MQERLRGGETIKIKGTDVWFGKLEREKRLRKGFSSMGQIENLKIERGYNMQVFKIIQLNCTF